MKNREKALIGRLLRAFEASRADIQFTVPLPPPFDALGRKLAEVAEIRRQREATLRAVIAEVEACL